MSTRALTISVVPHDGLTHEELWRMLHGWCARIEMIGKGARIG